jgi:hypothetical protein
VPEWSLSSFGRLFGAMELLRCFCNGHLVCGLWEQWVDEVFAGLVVERTEHYTTMMM